MSVSNLASSISEPVKHGIDYFAVGAFIVSVLANVMPVITAVLTALWLGMRLVEGYYSLQLKRREYNKDRK